MNADAPILEKDQDSFGYFPFADLLARQLSLNGPQNLTVGIESAWGSGKTSFLNLLKSALLERQKDDIVLVNYCPWIYSTIDSLLLGFCSQISAQLSRPLATGNRLEKVGIALDAFSYVLSAAKFIPGWELLATPGSALKESSALARAAGLLEKTDISKARENVQDAISSAGKKIIVVIDDVDRLTPVEIRLLFQFLKAVADFSYVTYIVSYDYRSVVQALSFDKTLDGSEFLKKFIQLPIRLPRLGFNQFANYFRMKLGEMGCGLSESEAFELRSRSVHIVKHPLFKTPRDVVRALNMFQLKMLDCEGEVDPVSVFSFVCLDLYCPEAIDVVRSNPNLFLSVASRHHKEFSQEEGESIFNRDENTIERRMKALDIISNPDKKNILNLIQELFAPDSQSFSPEVRSARSPHAIIKLLYGGSSPLAFSVSEARDFITQAAIALVKKHIDSGDLTEWFHFVYAVLDEVVPLESVELSKLIMRSSEGNATDLRDWSDPLRLAAQLAIKVLQKTESVDLKRQIAHELITGETSLFASQLVAVRLSAAAGLWRKGHSFPIDNRQPQEDDDQHGLPPEDVIKIQNIWLERVREAARSLKLLEERGLAGILHRWGQFNNNDYSEVQNFICDVARECRLADVLQHWSVELGVDDLPKVLPEGQRDFLIESLGSADLDLPTRKRMTRIVSLCYDSLKQVSEEVDTNN